MKRINIGKNFKFLRKKHNYKVTDIINLLKEKNLSYSEQSIYKWEQGVVLPSINVIIALCEIYKTNISYITEEKLLSKNELTANEVFLLNHFRNDFEFKNLSMQILKRLKKINRF